MMYGIKCFLYDICSSLNYNTSYYGLTLKELIKGDADLKEGLFTCFRKTNGDKSTCAFILLLYSGLKEVNT